MLVKPINLFVRRKWSAAIYALLFLLSSIPFDGMAQQWDHVGLTNSTRNSDFMIQNVSSATHTNGDIYMAYHGRSFSVYVRKLNRATGIWQDVLGSISPFNSSGGRRVAIAITKNGTPIVAIKHYQSPYNISVYRAGTSQWEQLGGFNNNLQSAHDGNGLSLVLDDNDVPHVLYQTSQSTIAVKKFQTGNWIDVGNQQIGVRNATEHVSLAIDHNNALYMCYAAPYLQIDKNISVRKLVGSTWQLVSNELSTNKYSNNNVLFAIDSQNQPYVALINSTGTIIKRLEDHQEWTEVARAFTGITYGAFMHIDKNDKIYISGKENSAIGGLSVAMVNRQTNGLEFVGTRNFTGATWENVLVSGNEGEIVLICTDRNVQPTMTTRIYNASSNAWEIIDNPGIGATRTERFVTVIDRTSRMPHIAYAENAGRKAVVKRYQGTGWVNVGPEGFSSGTTEGISLAFDGQGVAFVCFADGDHGGKATVMSYHRATNNWQIHGNAGFSAGGIKDPSLSINNKNEMFITYIDEANGNRITSMKYDASGQTWAALASPGFSFTSKSISTAFDKDGNPAIAYITEQDEINAVSWNGYSWTNIGTGKATSSAAAFPSIAIDQYNNVFVSFKELWSNKAMVSRNVIATENLANHKSGPEWISLHEIEQNEHDVKDATIIVDGMGVPYIAYIERTKNDKVVIKRFHQNEWNLVGEQSHLSSGGVGRVLLSISEIGEIYATYSANGLFMQKFDTSVLPIQLGSFTAQRNKSNVSLYWRTEMEQDNKGFNVETSTDGFSFNTIGSVTAKNVASNYAFVHKNPKIGVNYYRLKQIDNNGNFSYSKIVSVNFVLHQTEIVVYPNPARDIVNLTNVADNMEAIIYDVFGRKIKSTKISGQKIEIIDLRPGIYFISVAGQKVKFIKS